MTITKRVKVRIQCKQCGERFILRGKKEIDKVDTGFRRCICDNAKDFDLKTIKS